MLCYKRRCGFYVLDKKRKIILIQFNYHHNLSKDFSYIQGNPALTCTWLQKETMKLSRKEKFWEV